MCNGNCDRNADLLYLRLIDNLEAKIMSELSDKLDALKASQDAAIARVVEDVAAQQAEIDDLRTKVTTPEDIAKVDAMQAANDALDPVKPATLPEEPPAA